MAERAPPQVYSIAAHRGFADALVAGLVPRYREPDFGLARLTLLVPSARARRTLSESFIRHFGETDSPGLLMPRMAVVGDLDLDEALSGLLDPLGAADIPPAADPTRRWLRLAQMLAEELGPEGPSGAALLRLAEDIGRTMDRLLAERICPEDLLGDPVLDLVGELAAHYQDSLRLFARIQAQWLSELAQRGEVDAATRRNLLFDHAARRWRERPPATPVVAAGVTGAAPALANLLRVVSETPHGAVILPDLDLDMPEEVWNELGRAGVGEDPADPPFAAGDAVTHPQYHLKLLLNRMGVARGEVKPWHRSGVAAAPPERRHAISNLFLPPLASRGWVDLPAERRRLSGVRIMESATPEAEAQAIAILVRQAVAEPRKRIAIVTPDRGLAARIGNHLRRWNVEADDSAGRPLSQTAAGRLFLLLAEVAANQAAPVELTGLFSHPLVAAGEGRSAWLRDLRRFELKLRGPRKSPGLQPLAAVAQAAGVADWWNRVAETLAPLDSGVGECSVADRLDRLVEAGQSLCSDALWAREDGRALSAFVDELRLHARDAGTALDARDLASVLRERMESVAVRPPYGGHPRVAIYGLLESRMTRADLVVCAGLNEGSWPAAPAHEPLLAPPVMRALGVPGADFRIGLSAHDLAGALGAPEVVLSRAARDVSGPAIPSRFLLRVKALLGEDLLPRHIESEAPDWAIAIDAAPPAPPYAQPGPCPPAERRRVGISVTALDRLRSDPYQFYARAILQLENLEGLDAEPSPAWRGSLAHRVLQLWHESGGETMEMIAQKVLSEMDAHPLMRALWRPRLMKALEWVEAKIAEDGGRQPALIEEWGEIERDGIRIFGKADRIDRLADGTLAIVDYKTGAPPSGKEVEAGYALQLGTIGLIACEGGFPQIAGVPECFEYWSLGKSDSSAAGFGYVTTPLKVDKKRSGIEPEDFLPEAERFLRDALDRWILGSEPFTARLNPDASGYDTYDQLMRLDEWWGREG